MALTGIMRVSIIPESLLERELVGCTLPIVEAHRFWFWLYTRLGWSTRSLFFTVPTLSRPVYRTKEVVYHLPDGSVMVTPRAYRALMELPLRPVNL
jgi:hypothetical protein